MESRTSAAHNSEWHHTWTARRPFYYPSMVLFVLLVAVLAGLLIREALVNHDTAIYFTPLVFIPVLLMFWASAFSVVRLRCSDRSLRITGFWIHDDTYTWDELTGVESHPNRAAPQTPALLGALSRNMQGAPRSLDIGGPAVRIQTLREDRWVSCPDPEAFLEEARRHRPDLVTRQAASDSGPEESLSLRPRGGSSDVGDAGTADWDSPAVLRGLQGTSAGGGSQATRAASADSVTWTSAPGPLFGSTILTAVMTAASVLVPLALIVLEKLDLGFDSHTPGALPALGLSVLLMIYLSARSSLKNEITVNSRGVQAVHAGGFTRGWEWSAITGVRVRPAESSTWVQRHLGWMGGKGRGYFGGQAVEITTTREKPVSFSSPDAQEIARAIEARLRGAGSLTPGEAAPPAT